jgi:hypothetical protein
MSEFYIQDDDNDNNGMRLDSNPTPHSTPEFCIPFPAVRVAMPIRRRAGSGISAHAKRNIEFSTIPQISGRKRKRQKIKDQMKGSIDSPPEICHGIRGIDTFNIADSDPSPLRMQLDESNNLGLMMVDRGLTYRCPSKSMPDAFYHIGLKIENGKTVFSCTCDHMGGEFDASKNSCSHIRATVVKVILDLIQTHQMALDVNDVASLMNAMMI